MKIPSNGQKAWIKIDSCEDGSLNISSNSKDIDKIILMLEEAFADTIIRRKSMNKVIRRA